MAMNIYEKVCSIQKIYEALSLSSPRNLTVTVRLSEGIEKCIKIKEIKSGEGKLTFVIWKKSVSIFLKSKTTRSHKVFQEKWTLQNPALYIFLAFDILCQSSFRSQFLGFILLSVSFFCRINLDNHVLLVSCVDLLKTKFTISLSELWVDHCFLLLNEYLSVSTQIFLCWVYGSFYHIFWPGQQLPLSAKVK